jgi:gliding motility-associated-like protein
VPSGWTITNGQGTTTLDVTAGNVAGNITVTAANGCGTGVASTLAVKPAFTQPVAPAKIIGNSVPCSTGGNQTYQVNLLANASSYTWTVPTGWTIVSGQGTELITVSPGANPGVISVTASNGCGTGPASSLNVMVTTVTPPTPGIITVSSNGSPCAGQQNVTYTIDDVIGASSYNWVVPAGWVITSGQGTKEIKVTVGSNAGQVAVTAVNGCGSGSASTIFTTPTGSTPVTSGIIAGAIVPCTGNVATTYSTTATGATSFTWSVPAGWTINTGQGTNQITVTPGSNPGNISVTVSNGCGASAPSLLALVPTSTVPPVAGAITGNVNVCSNEKNLKYSILAVTGASTYTWSVPAGWTIISGQGTVEIEVEAGTTGGDITVTPENACGAGTPTSITAVIRPSLVLTGSIKDESSPCTGLKYSVTPIAGATTYEWTVPQGWTITSGAGTTTIEVKANSESGTVSVSAENPSCISAPITADVEAKRANIDLDIPNAFSPNGDSYNEMWEIKNIENYPDNDLTVINRWGNEVYRQKSYRNTWNGSQLSAGTYYYILRVKLCNNEEKTLKGFIMIATE